MPELSAFEVLLEVAGSGSLNEAATRLGLTQQAVSSRMTAMETRTGVQLLARTSRGSRLTPAGVVVVQWADRLLQVAAEAEAGIAALREDSRRRLKVSASLTIAEQLLPGWLVSMQASARALNIAVPDVMLTAANSDTVMDQVRSSQADLGFVEGPTISRGLHSRVIGHDQLVLVVRPDHRWAHRSRPVAAQELAVTPLVSREHGSGTRQILLRATQAALGKDATLARPVLELSTAAGVRQAVLAGAGPAVVSELAAKDDIEFGRLRRVPLVGLDLHRTLRAIWIGAGTPPAGAARDLLAHIRRTASS
ncbi:MAG: LysR family transcriptional regulator [Propionibacteriaceae bacterium]|nr:LysR family transcriptional regulator [Propionibacteriaceae bacterium]